MTAILDREADDHDPHVDERVSNVPDGRVVEQIVSDDFHYFEDGRRVDLPMTSNRETIQSPEDLVEGYVEETVDDQGVKSYTVYPFIDQAFIDMLGGKVGKSHKEIEGELQRLWTIETQNSWLVNALGPQGAGLISPIGCAIIQAVALGEADEFKPHVRSGLNALETAASYLRVAVQDDDTNKPLCFDLPDQTDIATEFVECVNAFAMSGLGNRSVYRGDIDNVIAEALTAYARAQESDDAQQEYEPIVLDKIVDAMINAPDGVDIALSWQPEEQKAQAQYPTLTASIGSGPSLVHQKDDSHKLVMPIDRGNEVKHLSLEGGKEILLDPSILENSHVDVPDPHIEL